MRELLEELYGEINENVMMNIAGDLGDGEARNKSICQNGGLFLGAQTWCSLIAKPRDLKLWIADVPPCKHEFEEYNIARNSR